MQCRKLNKEMEEYHSKQLEVHQTLKNKKEIDDKLTLPLCSLSEKFALEHRIGGVS